MAKLEFTYLLQDKIDPNTGQKIGFDARPYIPIRASYAHGNPSQFIDALVDSGSDRNLFPAGLANMLGIKLKKSSKIHINGIGKSSIEAYPAKINLWIQGEKYETDADFSPEQRSLLLGRNGFFNLFENITFDENSQKMIIETK